MNNGYFDEDETDDDNDNDYVNRYESKDEEHVGNDES